jgi:Signal transduction histidine kinase
LSVTKGQKKEKIDLRQNISSVIKLFRHEIESIATLEVFLEEKLYIQGVDFKLFQLWTNIIKNAIYAIKEKKGDRKIVISSKRMKDLAVVSIKNNGPKIPTAVQNKIFDKFYTTKEKKGSGLGLGIVKSVIESHQASITLNSSQKETIFEFSFKINNES